MSVETEPDVDRAYAERPDPDEPWRYACPECGSVLIRRNSQTHISNVQRGPPREGGLAGHKYVQPPAYRCRDCGAGIEDGELIDRRKDQ